MVENNIEKTQIKDDDLNSSFDYSCLKVINSYIKEKKAIYNIIPDKCKSYETIKNTKERIVSFADLEKIIKHEYSFWNYEEIKNNGIVSNYFNNYQNALNIIEKIKSDPNNISNKSNVDSIINLIEQCKISSRTNLAKIMKKYKNENNYFFKGLSFALSFETTQYYNIPQLMNEGRLSWFNGLFCGMNYKKLYENINDFFDQNKNTFAENIENFESNLNTLNDEIDNITSKSTKFYDESKDKFEGLENAYNEKLKLEVPASYWEEVYSNYKKNGMLWLIIGSVLGLIFATALVIFFIKFTFQNDNTLVSNIIKNTTFTSLIGGIGIYIIRFFFKLSMSSFHLSRDAKEREQLTYFYLSLSKNNNVSEKERALILNSLFSRSDTGLLKGESSPSMSANITDLINK